MSHEEMPRRTQAMESNVQRCQVRLRGVRFLQQLAAIAITGTRWHVESKWPLLGHEPPRKGDLFVLVVNKYLNKVLVCKKPGEPSLSFQDLHLTSWALAALQSRAQPFFLCLGDSCHPLCPSCYHMCPLAAPQ